MISDRLHAHEELGGYLLVALAPRDEGEDLLFTLCELRERALGRPRDGEEAYDALGHPWPEDGLPARHRPDGVHHSFAAAPERCLRKKHLRPP